jgi:mono/diheme cytochrome c family protein
MKATLSALAICLAALVVCAQEPEAQQGGPDTIGGGLQDPAAVERGRKLFVPTCGLCHGEDARGGADQTWFVQHWCFTISRAI